MKNILLTFFLFLSFPAFAADKESAYDRVMRTGTIRCAYFVVPPEFNKDPNTGKLSGIGYEVTEAVGRLLSLKIDWVEEVGFGDMAQGLMDGRYDAVCSSVFNRAPMARRVDFTTPFMYTPVGIFVRAGDARFDKDKAAINDGSVIISSIDGESTNEIAALSFPNAKVFSMPQTANVSMLLENVAAEKADVALTYMANFYNYDRSNPGKLKAIHLEKPVRAFGNTLMVGRGEEEFKNMLSAALNELLNSGEVDDIITRNEVFSGAYYRVDQPYRIPR